MVHKPIKYLDEEDDDDEEDKPKLPEMNYEKILASLADDQDVSGDAGVPKFTQVGANYFFHFCFLIMVRRSPPKKTK